MDNQLICGLSSAEIEDLKLKEGALVLVTVNSEDQNYQVIFKEPTFLKMEVSAKLTKDNEYKGMQAMYDNYVVKADDEITKRDMLKIRAIEALIVRINQTSAEAKNL